MIYKLPQIKQIVFLETREVLLTKIRSFKGDKILVGDINKDSAFCRRYRQLLPGFNFEPQNSHPTRVREKSQSCIDHIIADHALETLTVMNGRSDHFALGAKKKIFKMNQQQKGNFKNCIEKFFKIGKRKNFQLSVSTSQYDENNPFRQ